MEHITYRVSLRLPPALSADDQRNRAIMAARERLEALVKRKGASGEYLLEAVLAYETALSIKGADSESQQAQAGKELVADAGNQQAAVRATASPAVQATPETVVEQSVQEAVKARAVPVEKPQVKAAPLAEPVQAVEEDEPELVLKEMEKINPNIRTQPVVSFSGGGFMV